MGVYVLESLPIKETTIWDPQEFMLLLFLRLSGARTQGFVTILLELEP